MTVDYVNQKFPQFIIAIQSVKAKDATFCEICADYNEICTWLAARDDSSVAPDPEEWTGFCELKRSLEHEILNFLEANNELTS